jgi:hypothetical protein
MRAVEIERRRAKLDQIRRASDLRRRPAEAVGPEGHRPCCARGRSARVPREAPSHFGNVLSPRVGGSSDRFHSLQVRVWALMVALTSVRISDGASSCEISSAIGEHRQVAREVRLTSELAAYQCVPHGAESGALVVRRTRSRGRRSAAAGRRARGQEG